MSPRTLRTPLAAEHGARHLVVDADRGDAGARLDHVLLRHLGRTAGVSRTRLQRLIDAGRVLVNGRPARRPAARVAAGDRLEVSAPAARVRAVPEPEALPLDVLYEDGDLLAVNKPAGLVVHPTYRNTQGTLINALLWHGRDWPSGDRPLLVQRLDRQTSGLLLVARRPAVHAALQRAMSARRIDKDYLAVVWNRPEPPRGVIDLALDRDPWDRRRVMVTDRGGRQSRTAYTRLATSRGARRGLSLVACRLITGRTHQIRVHLAARGWPIVGDPTYGTPPARAIADAALDAHARGFARQALHAWRVRFTHPVTGVSLALDAPLPADLAALAGQAGLAVPDPSE